METVLAFFRIGSAVGGWSGFIFLALFLVVRKMKDAPDWLVVACWAAFVLSLLGMVTWSLAAWLVTEHVLGRW